MCVEGGRYVQRGCELVEVECGYVCVCVCVHVGCSGV